MKTTIGIIVFILVVSAVIKIGKRLSDYFDRKIEERHRKQ